MNRVWQEKIRQMSEKEFKEWEKKQQKDIDSYDSDGYLSWGCAKATLSEALLLRKYKKGFPKCEKPLVWECPVCGGQMIMRKGQYGEFVSCLECTKNIGYNTKKFDKLKVLKRCGHQKQIMTNQLMNCFIGCRECEIQKDIGHKTLKKLMSGQMIMRKGQYGEEGYI